MTKNEIEQLMGRLTARELAEVDMLLRSSVPVDRTLYPFERNGRFWASEELCREASRLWPSCMIDDPATYMAAFDRWMEHVTAFSVSDPNAPPMPDFMLEMINPPEGDDNTPRHF